MPHVRELVGLELIETGDDLLYQDLGIENDSEIRESPDGGRPHLGLGILEELAVVGSEMFLGVLQTNAIGNFHYLICHKVPNPPTLVHCEFLDVRDQTLLDLIIGQRLREMDASVNSLHSHRVLVILVEVTENLEQILLWHQWDQLYHVIQHEGSAFSNLRDFVLRSLSEKTIIYYF